MKDYKGKLTTIYEHPVIQEYLSEISKPYGYLGHENRTDEMDIVLEAIFSSELIYKENVAEWICSRPARHFMDLCEDIEYFKENIFEEIILL